MEYVGIMDFDTAEYHIIKEHGEYIAVILSNVGIIKHLEKAETLEEIYEKLEAETRRRNNAS